MVVDGLEVGLRVVYAFVIVIIISMLAFVYMSGKSVMTEGKIATVALAYLTLCLILGCASYSPPL